MIWLLWISTLCAIAHAANRTCSPDVDNSPFNHFNFPAPKCIPDNYIGINSYTVGTKLMIQWTTGSFRLDLMLWQVGRGGPVPATLLSNVTSSDHTSYEFSGYPPQPLSAGRTFFFSVWVPGSTYELFSSDYFNLTDATSSNSNVSSASSSSGSLTTASPTLLPQSSTQANADTQPTSTKLVGIGVAIGAGCCLIGGAVIYYIVIRRAKAARWKQASNTYPPPSPAFNDKFPVTPSQLQYSNPPTNYGHSVVYPSELEHPSNHYATLDPHRRIEELHDKSLVELPTRHSRMD